MLIHQKAAGNGGENMENTQSSINVNDQQAVEICENVGRTLINQLDTDEVWNKVEQTLQEYLNTNNIKQDAATVTDNLEWSVKVKLKK
jgi:methyl coenzyme M reductase subunit D